MTPSRLRFTAPAALALVVALGLGSAGFARGPGHDGRRLEQAIDQLGLDAETRTAVFAAIDAGRPAARELRGQMRTAHDELRSLLDAPQPDAEQVMAQVEKVGALSTELRKQHLRTLLQVKAILGPEQSQKLDEALHQGHERWKKGCDGAER
jgi:Spy/CpxP family protein refolding chaperone